MEILFVEEFCAADDNPSKIVAEHQATEGGGQRNGKGQVD